MSHRSKNRFRAPVAAAVLILALGTAQAAVAPKPGDSQSQSLRYRRNHLSSLNDVLSFFRRVASVVAPAPSLPTTLPKVTEPRPSLMGKTDDPVVVNTGRKMVDGGDPM
jgi:hypothetical protein